MTRRNPKLTKDMTEETKLPKSDTSAPEVGYHALFAILGRRLYAKITSHVGDGECDEWCEEVMEMAAEIGLAKREIYDPEIHGSIDAEPGADTIWTWRHLPDGWQTGKPVVEFIDLVTGDEQPDLSKRGVLIIHDSAAVANS